MFPPAFFQYSERTIDRTETNDASKERSDTQLVGLLQKDIEKNANLTEQIQVKKKKRNCAFLIIIL